MDRVGCYLVRGPDLNEPPSAELLALAEAVLKRIAARRPPTDAEVEEMAREMVAWGVEYDAQFTHRPEPKPAR